MKSLVFVGAFNPPTQAHVNLAELAMKQTGRDKVIFVPSKQHYISVDQGKDYAFSDEERLEMLRLLGAARPWLCASDYEIRQEVQPRTYQTLCHIRDSGEDCMLLIGSDKLAEMGEKWAFVPEIIREFGLAVLERAGDSVQAIIEASPQLTALRSGIVKLKTPENFRFVSSTLARQTLREIQEQRHSLREILPPELFDAYETDTLFRQFK